MGCICNDGHNRNSNKVNLEKKKKLYEEQLKQINEDIEKIKREKAETHDSIKKESLNQDLSVLESKKKGFADNLKIINEMIRNLNYQEIDIIKADAQITFLNADIYNGEAAANQLNDINNAMKEQEKYSQQKGMLNEFTRNINKNVVKENIERNLESNEMNNVLEQVGITGSNPKITKNNYNSEVYFNNQDNPAVPGPNDPINKTQNKPSPKARKVDEQAPDFNENNI